MISRIKPTSYEIYITLIYTITNNPSHTTSTKCQYQIKQSCPILLPPNTSAFIKRAQHRSNLIVPTVTWNLWNPVNAKKFEPNTPSLIEKTAFPYSTNWHNKKTTPSTIDSKIPFAASENEPDLIEWCPHVTVTPEDNNNTVLSKGIP